MIERIAKWGMAWTALVGVVGVSWLALADPVHTSEAESARYTRDCVLPAGGWTIIDCSAAAAYSAALTANSRYLLQATADTVYFATDDAASGANADANDGYLNEGEIIPILTTDTVKYVTCLGTANAGTLKYIECQ